MKKVSLLVAMIAFVCGNMFAQSYNFDQYNVGDKVALSEHIAANEGNHRDK